MLQPFALGTEDNIRLEYDIIRVELGVENKRKVRHRNLVSRVQCGGGSGSNHF